MRLNELAMFTDDVDAAAALYERLPGTPPAHRGAGIAIFRIGGIELLVHKRYEPGPDDPPCEDHVGFAVDDVNGAVAELAAQGLRVEFPPRDYPWGRSAYLRDPDGRLLELQRAKPEERRDDCD